MKAAAIAFLVAASLAASLVLGLVRLGPSSKSLTPIELRDADHSTPTHATDARDDADLPRIEVPRRVEQTTFSRYRMPAPK